MAANVSTLPGRACAHYVRDRCLYEERMNPGLHQQWRCSVLHSWEGEYDRFLDQADTFDLELDTAARIWEQRMQGLLRKRPCPHFTAGPSAETACEACEDTVALACSHAYQGLCLLALPRCGGVCATFIPAARSRKPK